MSNHPFPKRYQTAYHNKWLFVHEWKLTSCYSPMSGGGRGVIKLGKNAIRVGHLCLVKVYFTNIQNKMTRSWVREV
jgi:hypothetical protein